MKKRYLIVFLLVIVLFSGCTNNKCKVGCGGIVFYMAIGFSRNELDSVYVNHYKENSKFTTLQFTSYTDSSSWHYPSRSGGISDTLIAGAYEFSNEIPGEDELIIPSLNLTYRITNMTLAGNVYENHPCHGTTPVPGDCTNGFPYLSSYIINGKLVSLPPNANHHDTAGYIYIIK